MSDPGSAESAPRLSSGGSTLVDRLFGGDGEMARLIRAKDWSATPLGPIEGWPQSLRTAVSICLGSRHPIVLWWGPERWMFYNDGYRPMLGASKHPQFLGARGEDCWAEIWSIIGPMMDQVIATGEATWSEDLFLLMMRSGYLEETYFTFSYSPLRDDDGRPSGIFNACSESTRRVLADRRLKTMRRMAVAARTAGEAATLCAEILGRNAADIPFAAIYLRDEAGQRLELMALAGLRPGSSASLPSVELAHAGEAGWPLARVALSGRGELVLDLDRRFDCLPLEPWGEAAQQAMVLPIARAGSQEAAGVLVLGISPRRELDDDYRGFFELVAGHVATAVSNARAYEQERARADKLAELDRAKTAFFSNVSHEFRTPLTLILGPLEDALASPEQVLASDSLAAVHRSALRLLRLVNNLLDFSRIEAGRLDARFEPIDLAVLTGGLAGSFQSLMESAGLRLVVDCPPLDEPIFVDRSQWEKIVLNLISNAFKFTFEGRIAVRLQEVDGAVELSVSDTGTGIPAAQLPRVFERFHRVEGARGRSFEGTGIGLALVEELVKQHRGAVRVESVLGEGSTFVVSIPRGRAHLPAERVAAHGSDAEPERPVTLDALQWVDAGAAAAAIVSEPVPPEGERSAAAPRARVLVADDNTDMREYLVRLLATRWTVEVARDGLEALEAARQRPPDLILSDVMMPRMDGVALLRELRADSRTTTIPVVLLSARAGEEAVLGALETGADDYLVKPFSARELLGRVAMHVEMARVRRAATEAATELAETRAALLADLDRKNQELEAFSYSVSHDLRAPLRAIEGFSQILLEDHAAALDEGARENLHRISAATQRMNDLIASLLALSRIERTELRRDVIDLSRLARRVADTLASSAPERRVELVVQDGLVADADAGLVQILLENVLGNAWKFTAKSPAPHVRFGATETQGGLVFYVKDNGAGFDQAAATRLFTPFQRLHAASEFPGTGIGLATVRRVVDRHGGQVWAEAELGAGATIHWTLPPPRRVTGGRPRPE